jgi:ureidoacrylate peracid hydrolase
MGSPARQVTVDAQPEAVTLDPARTAVILVDMQNDFGAEGGMFALGGVDLTTVRATIEPTARMLQAVRRAGTPIIYVKTGFRPDLADAGAPDSPNRLKRVRWNVGQAVTAPDGSPSAILVRDTWNTEIVDELAPMPDDIVVHKNRYSSFYDTELDEVLKGLSITTLVVAGWTTSVCVESTLRDAMFRNYTCLLLEDCTAEPMGQEHHEASLRVIQRLLGWVCQSADFITALEGQLIAVPS